MSSWSDLVFLAFILLSHGGDGGGPGGSPLDLGSGVLAQVHSVTFISRNNTRLLAHQGSRVHIPCRINKPPNSAMVTWTRRLSGDSGLQLLSVGDYTHVSDPRFVVSKIPNDNNWELIVTHVRLIDQGDYLCQTSTHPPQHIITRLEVVDAFSEILVENPGAENPRAKKTQTQEEKDSNQKEIFIKKGSQLKLKCEMKKATEKPKFIFWYHNHTMINYSPHTGKIVLLEEVGWSSVLQIASVSGNDGGNYTCSPQNILSDTVMVNIMEGDGNFAAVYKDSVTSAGGEASMELIGVLITAMIILVSAFE